MLFRENLTGPRWLSTVGVLTLVFLVAASMISVPVLSANVDQVSWGLLALLLVALLLILGAGLLALLRRISVTVSETHVDAHLSPFRVMHIPFNSIRDVSIAEVTPLQAGGIGWRVVGADQFVLWAAGHGVWLTLEDGRKRVICSARAEDLGRVIRKQVETYARGG